MNKAIRESGTAKRRARGAISTTAIPAFVSESREHRTTRSRVRRPQSVHRAKVIDSDFAHSHPYFQENGYNTSVALAPGATHDDRDGNGHGTGESANLLAVAPDVTFIGVKLDNEDAGGGVSLLEGFQEAMQHNPQVISVSLGYDLVQPGPGRKHLTTLPNSLKGLEAEIQAAVAAGVVVVFSAGNGHVSFPGMMPGVISAEGGYVDEKGGTFASNYASAFSRKIYSGRNVPDFCGLVGLAANHADYIMLPIKPSCEIDREVGAHDGTAAEDGWGVFSGTSAAAAPQLAGVCALLLQKRPSLTPAEIKSIFSRTAADVDQGSASAASNGEAALTATPADERHRSRSRGRLRGLAAGRRDVLFAAILVVILFS